MILLMHWQPERCDSFKNRYKKRGMKIRMDYQSKVNCMPNSLTLQYEADKKRSRSSVNILKSAQLER